jgi:hypothetical protein
MTVLACRIGLLLETPHRRHRAAAHVGQGGDLPHVVRGAAGVGRLPVIAALEPGANLGHLAGRLDGFGKLTLASELIDLLLQLGDPVGGLAAEPAFPGQEVRIRPAVRLGRRVPGQDRMRGDCDQGTQDVAKPRRAGFHEGLASVE